MTARSICSRISTRSRADAAGALDRDARPLPVRPPRLVPPARRALPAATASCSPSRGRERRPPRPGCSSPSGTRRRGLCRLVLAALRRDRRCRRRRHDVDRRRPARRRPRRGRARSARGPGAAHAPASATPAGSPSSTRRPVNWRIDTDRRGFRRLLGEAPGAAAQHRQAQGEGRRARHRASTSASTRPPGPITRRSIAPAGSPRKAPSRSCAPSPSRRAQPARCGSASPSRTAGRSRSQLWLVENGEATIHKLAYAEDAKVAVAGHDPRHGDVPPRPRQGPRPPDRLRHRRRAPTRRDWMEEKRTLWRLSAFNPRTVERALRRRASAASALAARLRSR